MSELFRGFERSNTTPIPDTLFDELLTELSGAELKVLLYIMRRTWGFKKDTDAISISQFQNGIVTREGKRLDSGCGIKRRETICQTLARLEAAGYIESRKSKETVGDNAVTVYCIRFKEVVSKPDQGVVSESDHPHAQGGFKTGLPVVSKPDHGSPITGPRVVSKPDPQYTELQETELQETVEQDTDDAHGRTQATDLSSSSLQKKIDLLSLAAPEVQALVAEWKVCHQAFYRSKKPFQINKTLISHAETLVRQHGLLPGELADIVERMKDNDKKGWYAEHGLHLGNVVNWVLLHPITRETPQKSLEDALYETMNRDQALEFAQILMQTYPIELIAIDQTYPDDDQVWSTCLQYAPDQWVYFACASHYNNPSQWERERIEQAVKYGQSLARKLLAV